MTAAGRTICRILDWILLLIVALLSHSLIASTAISAEILATNPQERARVASSNLRLAWISTGDSVLDSEIASGLKSLTDYLWQRTSVTLASPTSVDPTIDALMLYPLIYWGLGAVERITLPKQAIERLRDFLHQGGLLIVDTRDANQYHAGSILLRDIEPILKPPLLVPLAKDHVLLRSFYILPDLIGRYGRGKTWIASLQSAGRDYVAPLIITNIDLVGAWATRSDGRPRNAVFPGFDRQREFSYRSGINLVMYALNGHYKADQIHLRTILDRLTQ